MADKIYIGSGKAIDTKYGKLQRLSFGKKDIQLMLENLNSKGYVNLILSEKKEVGKYGDTHYMTVDQWTLEAREDGMINTGSYGKVKVQTPIDISEIPF